MFPVSGLFLSLLSCLDGHNLCLEVSPRARLRVPRWPRMDVVSVTITVCHGSRSPILFHPIPVFHHPVSSRFSLHGIYPLSLLLFPDIFSCPMWTDLTHVRDPYLRSLADKLPDVVIGARADNTTLAYLNGFKKCRSWASKFSEITVLPAATAYVALYLFSVLQASTSPSLVQSAFFSIRLAHDGAGLQSPTSHTLPQKVLESARRRLSHQTSKHCRRRGRFCSSFSKALIGHWWTLGS